MAKLRVYGSKACRLFYNKDGSPVHRKNPKERMSKKERLRKRRESVNNKEE